MDLEPADFNEFSDLIQSLYGALIDDEPWRSFLLRMRDYMNAKHAALILTPPNSPTLGTLINPTAPTEEMQRYLERYLSIDPFTVTNAEQPNWYYFTNYRGILSTKLLAEAQ